MPAASAHFLVRLVLRVRLSWPVLLLAVACPAAHAIDLALTLAQLHHTAWATRDGAPAQVESLAQTGDGTLWLGSATGLFRFDGLQFERFQPPAGQGGPTGAVSTLLALPDADDLWIGYRFGGIAHWHDGRLDHYGRADGVPAGTVQALARDADGRLWAASSTGLARFDGRRWSLPPQAEGTPAGFTYALHLDRAGTLWAVAEDGTWRLARGAAHFTRSSRSVSFGWLAERADGRTWISNGTQGVWPLPDADGPPLQHAPVAGPGEVGPILFDRDGALWIGSEHGLARLVDPDRLPPPGPGGEPRVEPGFRLAHDGGLSGDVVLALLEDREGSLWVSTNGGLDRFRANKLTRVPLPPGLTWPSLAPASGGEVWAGSVDTDAARLGAHPLRLPGVGPRITAVLRDSRGLVWMGGARGLWRIDGQAVTHATLPTPFAGLPIQAMIDDGGGRLRLSVLRYGQLVQDDKADGGWRHEPEPPGVPDANPLAMLRDARGRLWLGYGFDRLVMSDGEHPPRSWSAADGLEVGSVLSLAMQGSRLWLGGEMGLAVLAGEAVHPIRIDGAEALTGVSGIVADGGGNVWVNTALGIVRLPAAEIAAAMADPAHRVAAERMDFHDGLDGLPAQLRPLPTAIAADDGRLWFATNNSVVWIDPRRIRRNAVAPSVQIRALAAADRAWPLDAPVLPVGTREVDLRYGAGALAQPERVRFRVQLEGVDAGWQDAGTRRAAHYTNLAPGRYVFRVTAANEDGVWSPRPASIEFSVPPAFHQTWWFRLMWLPLGALLVWALIRWRLKLQAERWADRHEAILIERERIARELHDTLLQSVQGLILRFQSGVDRMPVGDPTRATLEQSLDRAEQVLMEGRDRVSELRAPARGAATLGESLARLGEELAEEHGVAFVASLRGEGAPLSDRVQDEAMHIGREALLNAFRHAGAAQIRLAVQQTPSRLLLEVDDDGRGMPPTQEHAAGRAGHWGLAGMRERARAIGARFTLASAEGEGTQVRLELRLRRDALGWFRKSTPPPRGQGGPRP